jgi:hypothetical protein
MGYCVNPEDTPHGIGFEIRRESVCFSDEGDKHIFPDGHCEISKEYLVKLRGLLNDSAWQERLLLPNNPLEPDGESHRSA